MREMDADSVDLIYLDPPFNSNATYNVLFRERSGEESAAQIIAFDDTWHWSMESEYACRNVITDGPEKLGKLLQALRQFLGQNDMMAYLTSYRQPDGGWPKRGRIRIRVERGYTNLASPMREYGKPTQSGTDSLHAEWRSGTDSLS